MDSYSLTVILNYLSVFVMFVCFFLIAKEKENRMQELALDVCMALLVTCIGFLMRTEATTAEGLISGQKLMYAFITHGMFFMLLFTCEYCKFNIPKYLRFFFHVINTILSFIVLTLDHHNLFYKSYWVVQTDSNFELEKEYGIFHTFADALFCFYILAFVVVAVIFTIKNIRKRKNYVWRILLAVMIPSTAYLIPNIFDIHTDLQTTSLAIFMIIVVVMIQKNVLYDVDNIAFDLSLNSMDDAVISMDKKYRFKGANIKAVEIFPELSSVVLDADLRKESNDIAGIIINGQSEFEKSGKVYATELKYINGRNTPAGGLVIWLKDITIQKNYNKLLEQQKEYLKSEVMTLSKINNTDELTGIQNRRAYEECINQYISGKDISNLTLISMDLNGLKRINDTVSHLAGDELLKGCADVLNAIIGAYGKLFRIGGDEFFALFDATNADIEQLIAGTRERLALWEGQMSKGISISIGIAKAKDYPGKSFKELLIIADRAMYEDKRKYYEQSGMDRRMR